MKHNRHYIIAIVLSLIIAVLIGITVYKYYTPKVSSHRIITELMQPDELDIVFGNDSASLAVYMYASYNCSYCRLFFTDVLPELEEAFIDTKKVKIVLRLTRRTVDERLKRSLKASVCVNKYGSYQYLHELLLNNFKVAYTEEFQQMIAEFTQRDPFVGECIDGSEAEKYLIKNVKEFESHNFNGTPTFVIGNMVYPGYRNTDQFMEILNTHLKTEIE